jgi:hypothetical protein
MPFRVLALVSVIICVSLFAQTPPAEPPLFIEPPAEMMLPPPSPEGTTESAPSSRDLNVFGASSRGGMATNAVTSAGSNGELWLDTPPSPFSTGLLLNAFTATPNIFMQLGASTSDASFSVRDGSASVFKVSGDGSALFSKGGAQRLRIYPNGNVALQSYGDTPYNARLFVQDGADGSTAIFASHQPAFEVGSPNQTDRGLFVQAHQNVHAGATNGGYLYGIYGTSWLTGPGTLAAALGTVVDVGTYGAAASGSTLSSAIAFDAR